MAIRSIVFYFLCLAFGIFAFKALHVPLAAFAFIGGAAAIAIGFGSQDIMNNFMSGLILLTEQPIRVDDVIELSTVEGVVTHIGMRSTLHAHAMANHELIVPNKSLLDEQVTNYTLSDNVVRRMVTMTVDRSVPIEEARQKMMAVAVAHPLVLQKPPPVVLVKDIDNYYGAVAFEVYFAVNLKSFMECAMVQSAILEEIGRQFPPVTPVSEPAPTETPTPPENGAVEFVASNGLNDAVIVKELRKIQARMRDA